MSDAYQIVTDRILSLIDEAGEWTPPWRKTGLTMPVNAVSKHKYQGINVFTCWATADAMGYRRNRWATFKQWQTVGGRVRKGEKGTPILFFKEYVAANDNGNDEKRVVAKLSYAFNEAQVDGIDVPAEIPVQQHDRHAAIDAFIAATGATITEDGQRACYIPSEDAIRLPSLCLFREREHFYSTAFHELVHWTGAKHRLDRQLSTRFGSHAYAAEELIAEMGAAFLASEWSIENVTRQDHAAYLSAWLKLMKEDKRALVTAASQASKAVAYLNAQATNMERLAA